MVGDKLSPKIDDGDLVYYDTVPISEIDLNNMIVSKQYSLDRGFHYKLGIVTSVEYSNVWDTTSFETKNLAGGTGTVEQSEYVGKASLVIPNAGYVLNDILKPPKGIWILIIILISPMVIMKLRERNKK